VGVATGFASQDLLKIIFGGLMILFDKRIATGAAQVSKYAQINKPII